MSHFTDQDPDDDATKTLGYKAFAELQRELLKENSAAASQLMNEYLPRLTRLAAKMMNGFPSACEDEEDIAQSTIKSFFRQFRAGQLKNLSSPNALWALLTAMARNKTMNRIRRERTAKRGSGNVINEVDVRRNPGQDSPLDTEPGVISPEDFDLACEELLHALPDDELRMIAILLFRGLTQREIAKQMGRDSPSAVQRKVELIRVRWRHFLADAEKS